ncbi:hypothetical protein, partial [Oribacterium parvum]|uniref:hypothetical protein n=1 Tax=Oribacterium parvum TaxID=1501329 RepID=UPI0028E36FDC
PSSDLYCLENYFNFLQPLVFSNITISIKKKIPLTKELKRRKSTKQQSVSWKRGSSEVLYGSLYCAIELKT